MDETLPPQNPFDWTAEVLGAAKRRRGRETDSMPERIGVYRIVEKLGEGGMGTVFKCRDDDLDRWVALKVLHRRYAVSEHYRSRFHREARTIARLSHPSIVQVYAITEGGEGDDPLLSIVMEYLEGESLDALLSRRGALPLEESLAIALATAGGLSAAHAAGVIHRDVKPSNLLVASDGSVRIVDFGLAKALRGDASLTEEGLVLGTPHYISPEQGRGRAVDHRSDIYSLGSTLYHMLSGRPPFEADSNVAVIVSHVNEEPPLVHEAAPGIPVTVSQVVARMMAKVPADRYQTYDELITDLEALREGRPPVSTATTQVFERGSAARPTRMSTVLPIVAGGLIGILLAIVVIIVVGDRGEPGLEPPLDQVHRSLPGGGAAIDIDFARPPSADATRFLRPASPDLAPVRLEDGRLVWEDREQELALAVPFARIREIRLECGEISGAVDLGLSIVDPAGPRRRVLRLALSPSQQVDEALLVAQRHRVSMPLYELAADTSVATDGADGSDRAVVTAPVASASAARALASIPPLPRLGQVPFDVTWTFQPAGAVTRVHVRVRRRLPETRREATIFEARCELDGSDWASGYVVIESSSPVKAYSASIEQLVVHGTLADNRLAETLPWSDDPPRPSS